MDTKANIWQNFRSFGNSDYPYFYINSVTLILMAKNVKTDSNIINSCEFQVTKNL